MTKRNIIILGAGLAGLSAAWHLKQKKISALVLEKEDSVGGLCRSKQVGKFIFDCDGHLLHFRNNYTLRWVRGLLKNNLVKHERSAWVNHFGIFSRYPFQANLYALPKPIASECLWGFIYANSLKPNNNQANFLQWINATFGRGMARHFMVPYNRKFWTVPLSQMTCSWSDKFIPQPTLVDVVNGFFENNKNSFGYNAVFWYPERGGISRLPEALEKQVGQVRKNCCVSSIDLKKKELTIKGRGKEKFDALILTIPLPELAGLIKPLPASILKSLGRLRWNSIFNLNLGLEGSCQEGKHWVYFPQKSHCFFRAGFFHNFSKYLTPAKKSSLYAEVSYPQDKPINRGKVTRQIINDLKRAGIIREGNKILAQDSNDIKYGYPVYDRHYLLATKTIKDFLLAHDIIACGRYGSWQYLSMEDALLDGKRVAEGLT